MAIEQPQLASAGPTSPVADAWARATLSDIVYQLEKHKIELEMQNEQLRQSALALEEARDRYLDLYEFAPVSYLTLNARGQIAEINLTGATMLGECRKKLLQRHFRNMVAAEDQDRWHRIFHHMIKHAPNEQQPVDLALRHDSGSKFHAHLICHSMRVGDAAPQVRIALTDVTILKAAESNLRIAATAFESKEGMVITDASNVILKVNQAFTLITGYAPEEALGKNIRMLSAGRHDKAFYSAIWASIREKGVWDGEVWNQRKNGEVFPQWLTITAVRGIDGDVSNYVATFSDITTRKATEEQIKRLAFYDTLTELPNRRLLLDRLHQALTSSARTHQYGALMFIDLDNFKLLNDTLGHDMGDLLLKQVARRITNCMREGDTVARLGGDEFVVILENLGQTEDEAAIHTHVAGEKLLTLLNQSYSLRGHMHHSSPSIGVCLFSGSPSSVETLLKSADIAMYQAKAAGRNTLCYFNAEMQAKMMARAALEADLGHGLQQGEFVLYYQGQMGAEGKVVGAEALLRWQHPRYGLVSPSDFIPVAEESGLILPLGQWVLETACHQLAQWAAQPEMAHLSLSVNVSARQFHDPGFVQNVLSIIDRTGANPQKLKLELTESLLLPDVADAVVKMSQLKNCKIGFSLDDFGTGYSSLTYLKRLPFDQLKIDKSFIRDVLTDSGDAGITQAIVSLAKSLGLTVIAEGVETEEQRVFLAGQGCQPYQGFLFSRPLPLEAFEAFLRFNATHG